MVRLLSEVRIMAVMIIGSLSSLFWLFVLIFFLMFGFSIVFTQAAVDFVDNPANDNVDPAIMKGINHHFGRVSRSLLTLFTSVTGGISWGEPAAIIDLDGPIYLQVYMFYIFFVFFSVLNIVTGVFVDGAIQQ